jgi:hypothetical protein
MGYLEVEIKRGFPVYRYFERPDFGKDLHARNKYIDRELRRLHEGWEGLTGFDYFDLAKNKLHEGSTGNVYNPKFLYDQKTVNDFLLWCQNHKLQEAGFPEDGDDHPVIENGKTIPDPYDPVCIKPRRFGWTSKVGSFQMYNAWKIEGCTQGATSCDDNRLKDLVADKLFYAREGCLNEKLLSQEGHWNARYVSFVFKNGDQVKKSTIWTPNTSIDDKAAQSPEGYGYATYFLDEWFLHPRTTIVTNSVRSTLINHQKQKQGMMIRGGSCNAMNKDAIGKLKSLLENIKSPSAKTKLLFVPGWSCQVVDEYGFTMKDESMDKKLKEREALRKTALSGDSEAWIAYENEIKSNPFSLDELIGIVESDYFSPQIIQNLDRGKLYSFNYTPRKCNIINRGDRVFFDDALQNIPDLYFPKKEGGKESEKYPYSIFEEPDPNCTYIAGCDPINFGGANKKGSMFALAIKNVTTNKYVACAEFRTTDSGLGYNLFRNLLLMYKSQKFPHGALCLMEKNAGMSIITLCQTYGTLGLLARDPDKKNIASPTDLGYHKTRETMTKLMQYGRRYLENSYVPFERFNDAFKEYKDDVPNDSKADICDAFLGCEYLSATIFNEPDVKQQPRKSLEIKRDRNGSISYYTKTNY